MSVQNICKSEEIIIDTGDYNSDDAIETEEHLRLVNFSLNLLILFVF